MANRGSVPELLKRGINLLLVLALVPISAFAQARQQAILPPALPWQGKSEGLVVAPRNPWITPAEQSDFARSPRYPETVAWLQRLVAAAPELHMLSLGKSPENRDIWMVIASQERAFTPAALRATGKPVVLVQAGIHPGEIDGKDAGMMLLRDMTVLGRKRELLSHADLLFVPIFSVDGHERFSPYGRINQRGPVETGWRNNAGNLNLNRDYAKLDTPEMRALVRALNEWDPDLYFDIHVTDGVDYQYDITFGHGGRHGYSPAIAAWLEQIWQPVVTRDLQAMGHIPGPLVFAINGEDYARGIIEWSAIPRFSNGYGEVRHLPTVLVENHSLKPYKQRVLGTYVLLESTLRMLATGGKGLREAITTDRNRRPEHVTLTWRVPQGRAPETIDFLGVEYRRIFSQVTGSEYVQWTGKPIQTRIPLLRANEPELTVVRPAAYWIPAGWQEVIDRLAWHGIQMERVTAPREIEVEMYRIPDAKLATRPVEGRATVSGTPVPERRRWTFAPGSVRISTDQPLGELAVVLLEPRAPDSFFQWGFFLAALSPAEYVEEYVMQPMAERMLAEEASLRREFESKLKSDSTFAASPRARLQWFYERTPFYDAQALLYPVAREL